MMSVDLPAPLAADIASGVLLLALGAYVASVRPRRDGNVAFGVFAAAFGVAYGVLAVAWGRWFTGLVQDGLLLLAAGLAVVASAALVSVVLSFPRPLGENKARILALTGAVFTVVSVVIFALYWADAASAIQAFRSTFGEGVSTGVYLASFVAYPLFNSALWAALFLFALRYRSEAAGDEAVRRQLALGSAGLVVWHAFWARPRGGLGFGSTDAVVQAAEIGSFVIMLAYAGLWLWNMTRGPPKLARNVAWVTLGASLAGNVTFSLWPEWAFAGGSGLMRLLGVAVFAYAILRHQLLGVDVKVRWTISKTTIAAVFVAVFFVVSETAQEFFGETIGSTYLGILAAGLLVFAIAPLSRLADRIAEKAVPISGHPSTGSVAARSEATYRAALRAAMRDGVITRREETHLAEVAENLGIGHRRALEIRAEVEGEQGG
ncbi:MAG: hypothetical protein ACT4PT_11460 [Methanobacteriota archaeon]